MKTRVLVMLALGCAMALMLTACTKKTENNVESKTAAAEVVTESEKEPAATETAAEPVQEVIAEEAPAAQAEVPVEAAQEGGEQ